ncbi:MBL fold metallo-hydrolase [Maridesulfovibrio frigidus]|uniref:MBL fold metallo-hydrolase n=1 Tax=Maridesulfovibrio frigidus TaxID=340956 RepID=UPI0004E12AB2|nr:MBL fold metallo-hydrolase [Maridesulfovibrio frigidus]
MKVCIWGARGSLPATYNADRARAKVKAALEIAVARGVDSSTDIDSFIDNELPFSVRGSYGTNTPCIQIGTTGDDYLICDCGTGLRDLGNVIMAERAGRTGAHIHILISHLHWDHLQGFPFFIPAYMKGNKISFYGGHPTLEKAFRNQQSAPFFPVKFDQLAADIDFTRLRSGQQFEIAGINIKVKAQYHPGGSYGYRFEKDGKSAVYSTDCEHKSATALADTGFVEFFKDADLLIMDAQYSFAEANSIKEDWGHSNNIIAVELSGYAGVKTLCLFHQEPVLDDFQLDKFLQDTRAYAELAERKPDNIIMAQDGLCINL